VFPAGPLRAPLPQQLARTDALVIVGEGTASDAIATEIAARGGLVFAAHLEPDAPSLARLAGKRVLAFAGIGDPARFFRTLRSNGIEVAQQRAFADHHVFSAQEIDALIADAKRDALTLVTTEKDLARLKSGAALPDWAQDVVPFAVALEFDGPSQVRKFLSQCLFKAREKKFRGS
jgi:tetraacyldisaccharide 4'-kinase